MELIRFFGYRGLRIRRAERQYVWGDDGRRYLDMHTGHGVAFLGHRNPYVVGALIQQLDTFMTASTSFDTDVLHEVLNLLELIAPAGLDRVAFLNSGAEAIEFALKLAKKHTGRKGFTAFKGSFHGRTFGALSVTWNPRYRQPFQPLMPDVRFGTFNDTSSIDNVIDEETAAVIVEPVQGEGGVRPATKDFMMALQKRVRSVGALLIVDEVQAGFGRTGRVWAYQHFGIEPDIVAAGKALGGGFPVSAVFTRAEIAESLSKGDHGSTYGGNPLALAAVKGAVEAFIKDNVLDKARTMGKALIDALEDSLKGLRTVREVRGLGLMIGAALRVRAGGAVMCAQGKGLLSLTAGTTVLRLLPPYLINEEDVSEAARIVSECVRELER